MSIAIEPPSEADLDIIHSFLTETYWSPGISREQVARAAANSICAIARDENGALVGYTRAVTDKTSFAWIADVMVLKAHQGKGIGRGLVRALQAHPEMQNLRRWVLGTRDAHSVYAACGFAPLAAPDRYMEIRMPNPYGKPVG